MGLTKEQLDEIRYSRIVNASNTHLIFPKLQRAEISCGRAIELLNAELKNDLAAVFDQAESAITLQAELDRLRKAEQ